MESSGSISHQTIQESLFRGASSVNHNILSPLGINRSKISFKKLLELIYDDLAAMNFQVTHTDNLYYEGESIPGYIFLKTYDRKDGGVIKLNRNYPNSSQLETLIHEYIHIKDETLPILPMDINAVNIVALHYKPYLRNIEFQVDITANSLMMPPDIVWGVLIEKAYNIDNVLENYRDFNKRSVLRWIALIDRRFTCHFACVDFEKNFNNDIVKIVIDESFTYNHISDPRPFDILAVLENKNSAAYEVRKLKKNNCVHKASNINGEEYYCFAYYQTDLLKKMVSKIDSGTTSIKYDRLIVIGWKKIDYDLIQMYLTTP